MQNATQLHHVVPCPLAAHHDMAQQHSAFCLSLAYVASHAPVPEQQRCQQGSPGAACGTVQQTVLAVCRWLGCECRGPRHLSGSTGARGQATITRYKQAAAVLVAVSSQRSIRTVASHASIPARLALHIPAGPTRTIGILETAHALSCKVPEDCPCLHRTACRSSSATSVLPPCWMAASSQRCPRTSSRSRSPNTPVKRSLWGSRAAPPPEPAGPSLYAECDPL